MDFFKEYLNLLIAVGAGIAAYFNLKSDSRSQKEGLTALKEARVSDLETLRTNSQDIRELQMQHVATAEHRQTINLLLEKQDEKMERMDSKMDEMLKAITAVSTKLQERTKELHS